MQKSQKLSMGIGRKSEWRKEGGREHRTLQGCEKMLKIYYIDT